MSKLVERLDRLDERTRAKRLLRPWISRSNQPKIWWVYAAVGVSAIWWGAKGVVSDGASLIAFPFCAGVAAIFTAGFLLNERLSDGEVWRPTARMANWGFAGVVALLGLSTFALSLAYDGAGLGFSLVAGGMAAGMGLGISEILFPRGDQRRSESDTAADPSA